MRLSGTKTGSVNQYRGLGNQLWDLAGNLPTLDLRFADSKSLNDFVSGANLITFTRPTGGSYVDSDGLIKVAGTNTPRFDHNPATGECLGLLIEEMSINLIPRSEEFDTYNTVSGSVSANQGVAPNGAVTADQITSTGGGVFKNITGTTATTVHTISVFAKYISGGTNFLFGFDVNPSSGRVVFNLATGTVVSEQANVISSSIVPYGNGWYRCSVTATVTSTNTIVVFYNGTSGSNWFLWGAQLEEKAFPTSYIGPTLGSGGIARMADTVSITGSDFSSWYNQSEGTVFADFKGMTVRSSLTFDRYVSINGANTDLDEISLFTQTASGGGAQNKIFCEVTVAGTSQTSLQVSGQGPDFGGKAVIGYAQNNIGFNIDGATTVTDTSALLPTATQLQIFGQSRFQPKSSGRIKRLTYWPKRLPDSTLQAITTP